MTKHRRNLTKNSSANSLEDITGIFKSQSVRPTKQKCYSVTRNNARYTCLVTRPRPTSCTTTMRSRQPYAVQFFSFVKIAFHQSVKHTKNTNFNHKGFFQVKQVIIYRACVWAIRSCCLACYQLCQEPITLHHISSNCLGG